MGKLNDVLDYSLMAVGTIYSLDNIEQVLGLIVLGVQFIWLIIKLGFKVYKAIKNETYDVSDGDEIIEDFKENADEFVDKNEVTDDDVQHS